MKFVDEDKDFDLELIAFKKDVAEETPFSWNLFDYTKFMEASE
jgi:hypothetical protein